MMTPQALLSDAAAALNRGDWNSAQALAAQLLQVAPRYHGAYFIAGVAALRLQQVQAAIEYLRRAAILAPADVETLVELARAYVTAGAVTDAVAIADSVVELSPSTGLAWDALGVIYGQAKLHDRARQAFERAVEFSPGSAASRFNLASTLVFCGEMDAAEREFETCLRSDPHYWRAHLFLSQLRKQTLESNHIGRLQAMLSANEGQEAQLYLNLALSKELEDLGDYGRAFAHLAAGKRAGGRGRGYTWQRDQAMFDIVRRCFPDETPAAGGFDSGEPIFIIGMPRSGTTLVERILSSHALVQSAGELRNFMLALYQASQATPAFLLDPAFPERVQQLDWERLGRSYLHSTRPLTGGTAHFIDKLPHNFLYAGFIARALPKAKIVCLRRDPVDTCLSNFKQLFELNSPYFDYSYDLLDTGRYYLLFDRLMAHWQNVLPGRIMELQYEELVADQVGQTRRLLDFCGLEWDASCLRFENNAAPVATASAVQVRTPMNRDSIGRWRRYEPLLSDLLDLLASGGVSPLS